MKRPRETAAALPPPRAPLGAAEEEALDVEGGVALVEAAWGSAGARGLSAEGCSAAQLYATLGLGVGASSEALRRRWLVLSKLLHPDRVARSAGAGRVEGLARRAEEAFKLVARAYRILTGVP